MSSGQSCGSGPDAGLRPAVLPSVNVSIPAMRAACLDKRGMESKKMGERRFPWRPGGCGAAAAEEKEGACMREKEGAGRDGRLKCKERDRDTSELCLHSNGIFDPVCGILDLDVDQLGINGAHWPKAAAVVNPQWRGDCGGGDEVWALRVSSRLGRWQDPGVC
ncbi:hypothetical protein D5F01_LYC12883 [Larimichthys crocea]|uniref:Uncharacterized protein n=1 Tax=Larimichthys crocea TaxID=215358 RepID=A0A6G0IBY5_LARCR|nr:hypothetical protein D5F01_LYC12883 [Larimichthys crocea]